MYLHANESMPHFAHDGAHDGALTLPYLYLDTALVYL